MSPERFYEQFGITRRPSEHGGEGLFSYRMRAEFSLGVAYKDPNPLRQRLYRMWFRRTVSNYPSIAPRRRRRYDYSYTEA